MKARKFVPEHLLRTAALGGILIISAMAGAQNRTQTPSAGTQTPSQPAQSPLQIAPLVTEGVTFAPTAAFDKGQAKRYATQSSMTLRIPGANGAVSSFASTMSMSLVMRYKVRETKPDGVSQVTVTSEGGRMLDASSAFHDIPKEMESAGRLLTLDRQSHITAFKDQTAKSKSGGLDALFTQSNLFVPLHILPLPDKPVRVGESWTARYASPGKTLKGEAGDEGEDVSATLTLLGSEKIGDVNTIKIKQVLTVPYVAYTDAQGKPAGARGAQGRMMMQMTFTQLLNALPESGLLVRSEGSISGTIKFEGALLRQLPGDTMTIAGQLVAVRIDDNAPETTAAKSDSVPR